MLAARALRSGALWNVKNCSGVGHRGGEGQKGTNSMDNGEAVIMVACGGGPLVERAPPHFELLQMFVLDDFDHGGWDVGCLKVPR